MFMPPTYLLPTYPPGISPKCSEVARFIHEHTARSLTSVFRLGKINGKLLLSCSDYNGNALSW
jgi:hypothetical protein